jgi:MFS family permease
MAKIITVIMILVISVSGGIHRALLSILYKELTGSGFGDLLVTGARAPLEVWITLALSLAPFGLAKSIGDWVGGLRSDKSPAISVMKIGAFASILAVLVVILAILASSLFGGFISGTLLGLATGLFGLTEGLFYVAGTIRLTNLFSTQSRGFSVGLMESSVYSGYTLGALISGILSSGNIDILTPYLFAIIVSLFAVTIAMSQKSVPVEKTEKEKKIKKEKRRYSLRLFISRPRVAAIFLFAHIGKFADAFVWMLPLFLTTKVLTIPSNPNSPPDYLLISLIIGAYTATWALMMLFSSKTSDIFGRKWLVFVGFLFASVGLFGLALLPIPGIPLLSNPNLLIIPSIILGLGTGMFYPILTVIAIDIVVRPLQGEMIGILRSIRDLGYFTAPFLVCIVAFLLGGRLEDLSTVGVLIAFLLVFTAILQLFFLRESRPPWILIDSTIEHAKLAEEIVTLSSQAFHSENIHDRVKVIDIVNRVEVLESEADSLKRRIRKSLMQSIRPSADDSLFLDLLRVNDYIAGRAVIAATKLQYIPMLLVPEAVTTPLSSMGTTLPDLMRRLVNTMELLEDKIYLALRSIKKIRKMESEFDRHYSETLRMLYKNEQNFEQDGRFTIMTTIKECAEALEDGADNIEHAADLIAILGEKYRL